jgi:N4-(beta-N-acetylglucosaminyl)-L-asparaginase
MVLRRLLVLVALLSMSSIFVSAQLPLAVNTWPWPFATSAAFNTLQQKGSIIDAVEIGCHQCEVSGCGGSVGYGGSPDENGETTLDAMVIDGRIHKIGAVGALRRVRSAIAVARAVLEHTQHTLLVGDQATHFAVQMGFDLQSLSSQASEELYKNWLKNKCQPNYWLSVAPNASLTCGPYKPVPPIQFPNITKPIETHDTIAMAVIDASGDIAAGTSTNGLTYKIPGRVGDSPIPGSGAYVDNDYGACGETGNGDIMMRFAPCYDAVSLLRTGMDPTKAAKTAMKRILKYYTSFQGAMFVVNKAGEIGAASYGWTFQYSYQRAGMSAPVIVTIPPMNASWTQ